MNKRQLKAWLRNGGKEKLALAAAVVATIILLGLQPVV